MITCVPPALIVAGIAVGGCGYADRDQNGATTTDRQDEPLNALSEQERADGWALLFDGKTLTGWRGFKSDRAPDSWKVVDGAIFFSPDGERGDIITDDRFENYELSLEWKISPNGNSGIFYRVSEEADRIWEVAPEMQVLDNEGHPDGQYPNHTAGANYDIHTPSADATKPVGEWNAVRILIDGNHVEHWMNGTKIVEYEFGSPDWTALVAESKFSEWPEYGLAKRGHIGLQDHDDPVWYRNIKIRPLPPTP